MRDIQDEVSINNKINNLVNVLNNSKSRERRTEQSVSNERKNLNESGSNINLSNIKNDLRNSKSMISIGPSDQIVLRNKRLEDAGES